MDAGIEALNAVASCGRCLLYEMRWHLYREVRLAKQPQQHAPTAAPEADSKKKQAESCVLMSKPEYTRTMIRKVKRLTTILRKS